MQEKCSYSIDEKYKSLEKHQLQLKIERKKSTDFSKPSPYSVTQPCLVMFVNMLA